jgi:hypothetical protein
MMNLTATTILTPDEAIERALAYFGGEVGLRLIEMAGHMHGHEGSLQITLTGDTVVGRETYAPLDLLRSVLRDIRDRYGLSVIQMVLHYHTMPDETAGHLMIQVDAGHPVEVGCESQELDRVTRDFLNGLPKPELR